MIECADGCVDEDGGWGSEDVIEAEAQEEESCLLKDGGGWSERRGWRVWWKVAGGQGNWEIQVSREAN